MLRMCEVLKLIFATTCVSSVSISPLIRSVWAIKSLLLCFSTFYIERIYCLEVKQPKDGTLKILFKIWGNLYLHE